MQYARFQVHNIRGVPCLTIAGAVDIGNVESLEVLLQELASHDAGIVIVSLDGAEYFDSCMIHVLAQYIERMKTNRQEVCFVLSKTSKVRLLLDVTGLLGKMQIFPTMSEATAAALPLLRPTPASFPQ